jgi:hypothetical protein
MAIPAQAGELRSDRVAVPVVFHVGFRAGDGGELVPDAAEQAAIASAKRMRGRGKSLRYIAGKLALDGHRLSPESVRRMLAR